MPTLTSPRLSMSTSCCGLSATRSRSITPVAAMSITAAREVAVRAWSTTAVSRLRGLRLIA